MEAEAVVRAHSDQAPYAVVLQDERGHDWPADEPTDKGGGNTGPDPKHLLLSSLGACTAATVRMYAARKGWPLRGVRVELRLNPDGKPAAGNDIARRIVFQGELDDEQRERLLQVANACPIHKVLTGEVRIATTLNGDGAR